MSRDICIYHANCADGFTAAVAGRDEIDRAMNGKPAYAPGDAPWEPPSGNGPLHRAVVSALRALADGDT